jgi:hypothetical protein
MSFIFLYGIKRGRGLIPFLLASEARPKAKARSKKERPRLPQAFPLLLSRADLKNWSYF